MSHSAELIWFLVRPWVRDEDLVLTTKSRHMQSQEALITRHHGPARARVLRALIREDCHLILPAWLNRPIAPHKIVRNGMIYASEGDWLLDYAQASVAPRCAKLLQERGHGNGKGPKTRGGRQGRWKAWI